MQKKIVTPIKKKTARFSEYNQVFTYPSQNKDKSEESNSLLIDDDFSHKKSEELSEQNEQKIEEYWKNKWSEELAEIDFYINQDTFFGIDDNTKDKKDKSERELEEILSYNESFSKKKGDVQFKSNVFNANHHNEQKRNINEDINLFHKQRKDNSVPKLQRLKDQGQKKSRRVTMNMDELLTSLNEHYKEEAKEEQQLKKIKQKNRITLDVFAIAKMMNDQHHERQEDIEEHIIPETPQKQNKVSQLFSLRKNQANNNRSVKIEVMKYEDEVLKRAQAKKNEIIQIKKSISENEGKAQISVKRAQNSFKNISKLKAQILKLQNQLQRLEKDNSEVYNEKDETILDQIESYYCLKVIEYKEIPQKNETSLFVNLRNLHLKLKKQKGRLSDIKLLPTVVQEYQPIQNLFGIQTIMKILKKFHHSYLRKSQNLFYTVVRLNSYYLNLLNLSEDIEQLAQVFDFTDYQLSSSMEKFSFRFNIANKVNLQIILNLSEILDDYAHTSERPLIVFNMDNDECIEISIEEAYLAIKDKEKSILSIAIDRLCSIFIS